MAIHTREQYNNDDLPQVTAASTKAFNITWQNICWFWPQDFTKASGGVRGGKKEKADFFILIWI